MTQKQPQKTETVGSHFEGRRYVERIYKILQERLASDDPLVIKTVLPHEVLEITPSQAKAKSEGGDDKAEIKKIIDGKRRLLDKLTSSDPDPEVTAVRELLNAANDALVERNRDHYDDEVTLLALAAKEDPFERLGLDPLALKGEQVRPIDAQDAINRIRTTISEIPEDRREVYRPHIERLEDAIATVSGSDGKVDPTKLRAVSDEWNKDIDAKRKELEKEKSAYDQSQNDLNALARQALSVLGSSPKVERFLEIKEDGKDNALSFFLETNNENDLMLHQYQRRPYAYLRALGIDKDSTQSEIEAKAKAIYGVFDGLDERAQERPEVKNLENFLKGIISKIINEEDRKKYLQDQIVRIENAVNAASSDPNSPYGLYRVLGFDVPDVNDKEGLKNYKHRTPNQAQVNTAVDEALDLVTCVEASTLFPADALRKAQNAIVNASTTLGKKNDKSMYDSNMRVIFTDEKDSIPATPGAKLVQGLFRAFNNTPFVKDWLAPMLNDPKSLTTLGYARSGLYASLGLLSAGAGIYYLSTAATLIIGGSLAAGWGFPLLAGAALLWVPGVGFIQSASIAASKTTTQYARIFRNRFEDRISALVAMPVDPDKNMPYVRSFLDDLIEQGGYSVQQKAELREKIERLRAVYDNSADGKERGRFTDTAEGNAILSEIETWLFNNPLFSSFNYRNIYMGRDYRIIAKENELKERLKAAQEKEGAAMKELVEAEAETRVYRTMKDHDKNQLSEEEKEKYENELADYYRKHRVYDAISGEISAINSEIRKEGAIFQNIAEVYRMAISTEEKLLKWRQFKLGGEIASYPELQTAYKTIAGDYQELLRYISEKKVAGPDGRERRLGSISEQLAHINAPLISMFGNAAPTLVRIPSTLRVPG